MYCGESVRSVKSARLPALESVAIREPVPRISNGFETPPGCRNPRASSPDVTALRHTDDVRFADLSAPPASWDRTAECLAPGARFLRSADSLQSSSAFPIPSLRRAAHRA